MENNQQRRTGEASSRRCFYKVDNETNMNLEVTIIHQLADVDGVKPYIDGFEIKIFGMTVYRETNE